RYKQRIALRRIKVRRKTQKPVQIGRAVGCFELEQLYSFKSKLLKLGRVALREFVNLVAIRIHQAREGWDVVSLGNVDEMSSARSNVDRVSLCRIRDPPLPFSVEPHPMKLHLHGFVPVTRHVIDNARLIIDLCDAGNFKVVPAQRGELLPREIVKVKVPPTSSFGRPNKAFAILQKLHGR